MPRADFGTERVELMGASMSGSLTVPAAAAGADVDTWIDVSGPSAWEELLTRLNGRITRVGRAVLAHAKG